MQNPELRNAIEISLKLRGIETQTPLQKKQKGALNEIKKAERIGSDDNINNVKASGSEKMPDVDALKKVEELKKEIAEKKAKEGIVLPVEEKKSQSQVQTPAKSLQKEEKPKQKSDEEIQAALKKADELNKKLAPSLNDTNVPTDVLMKSVLDELI